MSSFYIYLRLLMWNRLHFLHKTRTLFYTIINVNILLKYKTNLPGMYSIFLKYIMLYADFLFSLTVSCKLWYFSKAKSWASLSVSCIYGIICT